MKVLRRNGPAQPSSGSSAAGGSKSAAAAGATSGSSAVPGTNSSSSSRPGIKVVSRAAAPPKPVYTGPSPAEVESRKVAELLLRLALDVSDANPDVNFEETNNFQIFEVCDGANDIDAVLGVAGFSFLQSSGLLQALAAEVQDLDNAEGREAALLAFKQLCCSAGRVCEPYVVPLLPLLLERMADKVAAVREAAGEAAQALAEALCPRAAELALPSKHSSNAGACR